ncbi:hypothetical protein Sjap_017651 [Stephania japonica]|uniref:EF-hand domain-containing protein n=1 Tax=Stephania japonica TaxID=461633 RepID=A0AAP0I6S9_9MAGN
MAEVPNPNISSTSSPFARLYRKLSPKRPTTTTTITNTTTSTITSSSSTPTSSPPHNNICVGAAAAAGDMERMFRYFDEDGDGKVSPGELRSCVMAAGGELSEREAEAVVEGVDSDGDGLLGLEDFAKLMERPNGDDHEELREAFGKYEMEGTGCITPKSLKRMLVGWASRGRSKSARP